MTTGSSNKRKIDFIFWNNLLLTVIILLLGGGYRYATTGGSGKQAKKIIEQRKSPILKLAEERVKENSEEIGTELKALTVALVPPIANALYQELQQNRGEYLDRAKQEGELLTADLQKITAEKLKAESRDYFQKHRQVMAEEFPDYASEQEIDRLIGEFSDITDRLVDRYYLKEVRQQSKEMVEQWRQIEPVEQPGPDDPPLEDQLTEYLRQWTVLTVSDETQSRIIQQQQK